MNIGNYLSQLSRAIQYKKYAKNTEDSYVAQIDKFLKHFEPLAMHAELAFAFGVSRAAISLIGENKTWKHVSLTQTELEINL